MKFQYIDEISKNLLNSTFSVFCGAGVSKDAGLCAWEDLFGETVKSFYNAKLSDDIYLLAELEKEYREDRSKEFFSRIIDKLQYDGKNKSQHIDSILKLDVNRIWTTNFDNLIEQRIEKLYDNKPSVIYKSSQIGVVNTNSLYTVYKLNGSVDEPESMILTKSDFFSYFKKQRLFFEMLKHQLAVDSFLFVGYSFKDELVLEALREIKEASTENPKIHYRFVKRENYENDSLRKDYYCREKKYFEQYYNIKTIEIKEHKDIDEYLEKLYDMFCDSNIIISGSFRNIDKSDREYLETLMDAIIRKIADQGDIGIYSGNGRGLGEIVVARCHKYKVKRFVNRPLIFLGDSDEEKRKQNRKIISDCNIMLIVCGQDANGPSKNVENQFDIFIQSEDNEDLSDKRLVIPISSTGFMAEKISNLSKFHKLKSYKKYEHLFNKLEKIYKNNVKDKSKCEDIATIILDLINEFRSGSQSCEQSDILHD